MDGKSAQTLDPKLKEAYDRVMGTTLPRPASPPHQSPPVTPPTSTTPMHDPLDKMATQETHTTHMPPQTPQSPTHQAPMQSVPTEAPLHVTSGFVAPHEEKKPVVSGTLLIIAGVVFLIVYTLFWLKWFGVALPFLP